ncbi:hypothetical protein [Sinorhizobium meliloti]|uniref:hypothetical protein n=1 Tax=Rhizobium meliloti TaxID=382 RepID=UPI000FDA2F64|nr:hypothetical protein [Sinorhizobium meliloti]MDW9502245.1 hypothetical protein [Sinorhizobium meliloti]RVG82165.1 hypothetical protein CN219_22235 [Sinorhizobium meliloti]RVI29096.1 hypothetical protein CN197_24590 [Sinorhizobium meliloti]RVI41911.1 hypothetical protein CN196_23685 [Sinorhizobium meliloti]RVJ25768.1 hypothetical protein CN177_12715 [Sinorhizobium meliloti]
MDSHATITSVPVGGADRAVLIEAANTVFEKIIDRIEPENEDLTRALWDAGHYIDNHLFRESMLPMTPDYAVYLIDAFLVHYVIDLATEADERAANPPALP